MATVLNNSDLFPARFERQCECLVNGPAVMQPLMDGAPIDADEPGPGCNRKSSAVVAQGVILSSVVGLIRAGRPAAIFRAVTEIVIFAFQCVLRRWPLAHVGMEGGKGKPAGTHLDATSAIVGKSLVSRIRATILHPVPDAMFGGMIIAVGLAAFNNEFRPVAPATFGFARREAIAWNDQFPPADAATKPQMTMGFAGTARVLNHCQSGKCSACEIVEAAILRQRLGSTFHDYKLTTEVSIGNS